ncbi:killer cell lectin-like receptor subfamily F member 1 [Mauremys reevesii]|uniref:killer cell lectin-like receptor subfamily F member 1 n=1 Tax=Mauremys reevesii TaxID=260615 RepID=UPI00193F2525|nr:killer cell lectin-like receptor subfamily F member 1 [Mauremys reevesii]
MEDEEGYTILNLRPKWGCSGGLSSHGNPGSRQCPGWLQVALGAGNLILAVAVLLLAVCVSHLVSEKGQIPAAPGSDGARSRDIATPRGSDGAGSRDPSTAECSTCLERFRSQLCPPAPPGSAGGSGCKLCPTDWRLRRDKCYWVSRGRKTWSESRADCSARGSQLLVIRDPEELEFLKALTQDSNQFWVGLSISSPEKAWTWLDGSRLNQTQFPVSGWDDWNRCGKLWGNWIQSDTCSSVRQWICQRDAVPL